MEDKVIVDKKYIENDKVALKSNAVLLALGIGLFLVYVAFSAVMLHHMVALAATFPENVNVFQKIVYVFNSKVMIYAIISEFLSVALTALFINAADSEVYGIFMTARVFTVISVVTFVIPIFVVLLI